MKLRKGNLSPEQEKIINKRIKDIIQSENKYWKDTSSLFKKYTEIGDTLELEGGELIPEQFQSTVFGLKDGVAIVRHDYIKGRKNVEKLILGMTLNEWGKTLYVPVDKNEYFSLASAGVGGLGNHTFSHCNFNDQYIPYASFRHVKYDDADKLSSIQNAIYDFQLSILGTITEQKLFGDENEKSSLSTTSKKTIEKLISISDEFETLLNSARVEEDLQKFLKNHPFVLEPSARIIPKQKLGEDFVTDFVIVSPFSHGDIYTLVEIEPSSHPVFNQDGIFSSKVTHAQGQVMDWDIWIEKNKDYLQKKLQNFESPNYLIIIGRGNIFNKIQKEKLRAHNRLSKNVKIWTYDDVLINFRAVIENLKTIIVHRPDNQ